ncbi:MAG: tyrosine-type recombinase/integrase [Deltaproteobacteria bacterium]|nr:tyrosine-type recombinase/integrase [Deltaproteobacteria bacterium]
MDMTNSIVNYRRHLKRRNLSPHTVKNYIHTLKLFVLWLDAPIEKVDHRKVLEYVDHLFDRRLVAKTINCHLNSIRRFYDYLYHEEEIRLTNPVKSDYMLKLPQPLPRALKEEEVAAFFKVVKGRRDRAMFMLMLRCGLRVEEVFHLTVDGIDLDRQRLIVRNGKGRKDRVVYISNDANDALGSYLKVRQGKRIQKVFLVEKGTFKGKAISVRGIQKRMEYYARRSGVKVSCHHMRHTMATQMLNADADLATIQDLLGHNWITTTERYCKISNLKVQRDYFKAMEKIARRDQRRSQIEERPGL